MERGLIWLPLLILFIWLAWSGKNEYEKLEAYKIWAEKFEQSKYDIYAVLGKKGDLITWGKPTAKGIISENSFSLQNVKNINLAVNNQLINWDKLPEKGSPILQFTLFNEDMIKIPFTEIKLAVQWYEFLQKFLTSSSKKKEKE